MRYLMINLMIYLNLMMFHDKFDDIFDDKFDDIFDDKFDDIFEFDDIS